MRVRTCIATLAGSLVVTCAAPAAAEIVVLTSGGTLSVKGHRIDGTSMVLTLRSGGEVTCDRSIVERVLPDEVPYPEPAAESGQELSGSAPLESTPYGELIAAV